MSHSKEAAQQYVNALSRHVSPRQAQQMREGVAALPDAPKQNKYGAKKAPWLDAEGYVNGKPGEVITFDSEKERDRWCVLLMEQQQGLIAGLEPQAPYDYVLDGTVMFTYKADFVYLRNGQAVIEDVKGYKKGCAWQHFQLKRKLIEHQHGLTITIV